jgi:hypothetical protein
MRPEARFIDALDKLGDIPPFDEVPFVAVARAFAIPAMTGRGLADLDAAAGLISHRHGAALSDVEVSCTEVHRSASCENDTLIPADTAYQAASTGGEIEHVARASRAAMPTPRWAAGLRTVNAKKTPLGGDLSLARMQRPGRDLAPHGNTPAGRAVRPAVLSGLHGPAPSGYVTSYGIEVS